MFSIAYHGLSAEERISIPVSALLQGQTEADDDVLALGNNAWLYLDTDRSTENRYFYQTPPIEISQTLREDFLRELREHPSDVIVSYDGDFSEAAGDWRSEVFDALTQDGYTYLYTDPFGFFTREASLWSEPGTGQ